MIVCGAYFCKLSLLKSVPKEFQVSLPHSVPIEAKIEALINILASGHGDQPALIKEAAYCGDLPYTICSCQVCDGQLVGHKHTFACLVSPW